MLQKKMPGGPEATVPQGHAKSAQHVLLGVDGQQQLQHRHVIHRSGHGRQRKALRHVARQVLQGLDLGVVHQVSPEYLNAAPDEVVVDANGNRVAGGGAHQAEPVLQSEVCKHLSPSV
jgi:hypothetical protein